MHYPRPVDGVRVDARPGARWRAGSARPVRPASTATSPRARSSSRSSAPRGGRARRPSGLERRVHGHGRTAGQLRPHVVRRRATPRRRRHLRPPPHRVDGRHHARHPPARGRAPAREPGGVAARRQRRAPRRAGPDQPPLPPRRARRGMPRVPRREATDGCRSSGRSSTASTTGQRRESSPRSPADARPRQPHPAQPDAGVSDAGHAADGVRRSATYSRASAPTPPSRRTAAPRSTPRAASSPPP